MCFRAMFSNAFSWLWVSLSTRFHSHTMNSTGHFYLMYGDMHSKWCKVNDNCIWWKVTVVQIFFSQQKSRSVSWPSGIFFSQMRVTVLLYTCPLAENHLPKESENLDLRMAIDKDLVILSFVILAIYIQINTILECPFSSSVEGRP